MLITYFSATDMAIPAMIGSVLRGAAAIILCAVVLARLFGMTGVWLSFLASELITFIVILPIYRQRRPTVKATYEK